VLIYDLPVEDEVTYDIQLPVWGHCFYVSWGPEESDRQWFERAEGTDEYPWPVIPSLSGGQYKIKICGHIWKFGHHYDDYYDYSDRCTNIEYLTEVEKLEVSYLSYAFLGAFNLVKVPDRLKHCIRSMDGMFAYCYNFNYPINQWNVSEVESMDYVFNNAASFNQPLDMWDTCQVGSMVGMFACASSFNQPLNSWNVSNVNDMCIMFLFAASFNQPLDMWDVSNVYDMCGMFAFATNFNQPIFGTNVDLIVQSFAESFRYNVSSVERMAGMFLFASNFNQPLDTWDTSSVTDMEGMFAIAKNFNQPIQNWITSSVTSMWGMFFDAMNFNQPINAWDVSCVTDMSSMFAFAINFNQSLHLWDITSIDEGGEHMLDFCGMSQYNYQNTLIGWYNTIQEYNDHIEGTYYPTIGAAGLVYNKYRQFGVYGIVTGSIDTDSGSHTTGSIGTSSYAWVENSANPSIVRVAREYFRDNITGDMEINYDT